MNNLKSVLIITLFFFSCQDVNSTDNLIKYYSKKNNLEANLVKAVITIESNFNSNAVSNKNARGYMQVIYKWHKKRCKLTSQNQLHNERINIACGTKVLKHYINLCGSVYEGLRCYNAGRGGARKGLSHGYATNVLTIKQSLDAKYRASHTLKVRTFSLKPNRM